MKKLLIACLILATAVPAMAVSPHKVGFRAYSTATPAECAVFGMTGELPRASNSRDVMQQFSPDPSLARTFSLGTKGFANYSVRALNVGAITWDCRSASATATKVKVKVFMNGVETHFLSVDSGTWFMGQ